VNLDLVFSTDGALTAEVQTHWLEAAGFENVVAVPVDDRRVRWEARRVR
jgi:hypothetical protein